MAQRIYKENHYVPQWYQRRFLPSTGEQKFRHLDLRPEAFIDAKGIKRQKKGLRRWGTDRCFKQTDLYTTRFGALESTEIEQFFFGRVDREGREAVEYFTNFSHPSADGDAFPCAPQLYECAKAAHSEGTCASRRDDEAGG